MINITSTTYRQDAWRRLKGNRIAMVSLALLLAIFAMCIIGPFISPYKYTAVNSDIVNQSPSLQHLFGTDDLGRDIFARIWAGGRVSMLIGVLGAFSVTVLGVLYGGISGYFGGTADDIMMRAVEVMNCIPYMIVAILIAFIAGQGIGALILAMTITGWGGMARLVRGQVLQLREQPFVLAAKALGASPGRIISKHLLPNTVGVIIVQFTLDVPIFIFGEAFLSFIGLGIQSPGTSWGAMAAAAQQHLMFYPYQIFFPALLISMTMLAFNLLGDGLRDALDPTLGIQEGI
ncbi:MAG: oligopeptide/dipeptide transporter, permease protein [Firmicutes bacterium]|nr:oligopeptide/dipeptide transporter, permease protein [Bacillota bacterium]